MLLSLPTVVGEKRWRQTVVYDHGGVLNGQACRRKVRIKLNSALFTRSAGTFAAGIDGLCAEGKYLRGELFLRAAQRFMPVGGEVLDYGCGPGRISLLLARVGLRVHGMDPAAGMIEQANAQDLTGLDVRFSLIPETGTALPTGGFDAVVCSSVIEYVPVAAELLTAFHRALRPQGVLILSYANRRSLWRLYANWRNPHAPHLEYQKNVWSFAEARRELDNAGFAIVAGPHFFDSPFDHRPGCGWLARSSLGGTLGLVVARRG